jgi:tetratricopeptide (TPR) repeat protein
MQDSSCAPCYQRLRSMVACLSLVVFVGQAWAQEHLATLIRRVKPSVVTVIAYDARGELLQQGSGFFITEDGQLVTNRHVLQESLRAEVKTWDGKVYEISSVLAEDQASDLLLARIHQPEGHMPALPITRILPEVGERIVVVGSPLGLEQTVSDGIVSAVRDLTELGTIMQMTAPISPGSSGGPVVNLRGEVVGVAVAQMRAGQNLNFAVPGERIASLKPGRGWTLGERTTGVSQEGIATAAERFSKGNEVLAHTGCAAALQYFEKAVAMHPRYAAAWRRVGECKRALHRLREAVAAFEQLNQLEPHDIAAYEGLAAAYIAFDRRQDAMAVFKQALRSTFALFELEKGGFSWCNSGRRR